MTRTDIILSILTLYVLCAACVKDPQDIPNGLTEDPAFGMKGQFGQDAIDINAGIATWTAVPEAVIDNGGIVYKTVISRNNCGESCEDAWTFRFYPNLSGGTNATERFLQTMQTGDKQIAPSGMELDSTLISLATHPDLFLNGYSFWEDVSNAQTINAHSYNVTLGHQQSISACLQSYAYTGCQYMQCIYYNPATGVPCITYIEPKLESARYLVLTVRPQGTPPFQISWDGGATGSTIVIPLQDSSAVVYANVSVTDYHGNRSELVQNIRVHEGVVDACYFPVQLTALSVPNQNPEIVANQLAIEYVDSEGFLWTTHAAQQNTESFAWIEQVRYYDVAPYGQPAYKVDMRLKALLTNTSTGESRWLDLTEMRLPVSHP